MIQYRVVIVNRESREIINNILFNDEELALKFAKNEFNIGHNLSIKIFKEFDPSGYLEKENDD